MQLIISNLKRNYLLIAVFNVMIFMLLPAMINGQDVSSTASLVNTSHLDAPYEEINIDGKNMGIIHIYSDHPDYKWIGDDDEGIACVDDASRAAMFYINNYAVKKDTESLRKSERLIRFLLFMQTDNGFFYNFIFNDYSINKNHKNSIPEPNWWTWRAMQALAHSYKTFKELNPELASAIRSSLQKSIEAAEESFPSNSVIQVISKLEYPSWLPFETASDQASELVLALVQFYKDTGDSSIIPLLNSMCDGILLMQKGSASSIPYCAFLSWQNTWHAYGNIQSYALLKAYEVFKRDNLKTAALNEVNFFYPYLLKEGYLSSFTINKKEEAYVFSEIKKFSQIAYNFRPIIYACPEAFRLTEDSVYIKRAVDFSKWFFGHNSAGKQMYDPSNGRCFDGIDSTKVNLNSGAESTIEALLSMQLLEKYNISLTNLIKQE